MVIALLLGTLLAGSASASGDGSHKATLKLVRGKPLTLRGTSFAPNERVRLVVVSPGKKATKRLTAGSSGAFIARFSGQVTDRCSGFTAFAVGAQGSRAGLASPNVYCPPRL
jgi:hypothetical protein